MFLGFDRSGYPGDDLMQSLWDSVPDLTFVCLYLAPAPSHRDKAWMRAAPTLREMGWGLLPTYVGQQVIGEGSHTVTAAQGEIDGQDAIDLAHSINLEPGSVLYLDIENGAEMPANQVKYVTAWIDKVHHSEDYWAGVYCSHFKTAQQVADAAAGILVEGDREVATWAFKPISNAATVVDLGTEEPRDPAGSGFAPAVAWQYRISRPAQNARVDATWVDQQTGATKRINDIDIDTSSAFDPSHPDAPPPGEGQTRTPIERARAAKLERAAKRHDAGYAVDQ